MISTNEKYSIRAINHIKKKIIYLKLDLKGLNILTEIGTNAYFFTPFIALLAGAKKVYIWAKDNKYAKAENLQKQFIILAQKYGFSNYEFISNKFTIRHISNSHIITNLGALRPFNKTFLKYVRPSSIISLMYDAWEIRKNEIDIDFCQKNKIKVVGVNEKSSYFPIFSSVEQLSIKMVFEAGYEIYDNKIIIVSNDQFGTTIKKAFEKNNAQEVIILQKIQDIEKYISDTDFIFFADYFQNNTFKDNQIINFNKLKEKNPIFGIIHLYGDFDLSFFAKLDIGIYPHIKGQNHYMSFTLSHLGLYPTLNLNIAGLKVAEAVLREEYNPLVQIIV